MKLLEHQAKELLRQWGIPTPRGEVVTTATAARAVADRLGPVAIKAQVASGGRGKAGGVKLVDTPDSAERVATELLGSILAGETVGELLVEELVDIERELYLAFSVDTSARSTALMFSAAGGVEIESHAGSIDKTLIEPSGPLPKIDPIVPTDLVAGLWQAFVELDAVLIEINPLAVTTTGDLIALDAKIELDDAASFRQPLIDDQLPTGTALERKAAELGLRLIELGGDIAILANGAGLTMATMDAVTAAGGSPANFLEIGGDAYTKATPALELVLSQPGVSSLLVNFCGAFARCDVMTEGVLEALETLEPDVPVAFSIHGTGQDEARSMVRERLGIEPHESMADAVAAAVSAADRPR